MALVRYNGPPELPPRQKIFPSASVVACALLLHLQNMDPKLECELRSGTAGPAGRAISSVFLHVEGDEWMEQQIDFGIWSRFVFAPTRREREAVIRRLVLSTYSDWRLWKYRREEEWQRYKWTLIATSIICVPVFLITYMMAYNTLVTAHHEALLAKASGEFETMTMASV